MANWRERAEWRAARLFTDRVRRASAKGARRMAGALGGISWLLVRRRRRIASANVRCAFPDRSTGERRRLVRSSFGGFAHTIVEALRLPESPPLVRWSDPNVLEPLFHRGGPAVILGGHLGNWEVAAWAIAERCLRLHLVVAPPHNPFVAGYVARHRKRCGVVPHDRADSVRPLLRALRCGEAVGTAADQWPGRAGSLGAPEETPEPTPRENGIVTTRFLGRPTPFGTGMFRLAVRARVPVIGVAAIRSASSGDDGPPLFRIITTRVWDGKPPTVPVEELVRKWAAWLERAIIAHPEQYLWMHRRWKTDPPKARRPATRIVAESRG